MASELRPKPTNHVQPGARMPPRRTLTPVRWMRENLFNTWYNTVLTLGSLWLLYTVFNGSIRWIVGEANWAVIPANLRLFATGTYPGDQLWRVWVIVGTVVTLSGLSAGAFGGRNFRFAAGLAGTGIALALLPFSIQVRALILLCVVLLVGSFFIARGRTNLRPWLAGAWVLSFPWTMFLMWGVHSSTFMPRVETSSWGGFTLTLLLAVVGIVASFPIGVLLALGRRSSLPVISWVCTAYIEVIRGMPLITILFMAHLMVPIFLPDFRIDRVIRAMIGLTAFTAAYMAENVRGGLQGVPKGQYEAAEALGMSGSVMMALVVLPQAIRSVIPSIVGQFISLFKDTSLVAIIGLMDLLGVARTVIANPSWLGLQPEVYLFAAVLYWIFSYTISHSSRRLERALGVSET